jgi:hypothetical protein
MRGGEAFQPLPATPSGRLLRATGASRGSREWTTADCACALPGALTSPRREAALSPDSPKVERTLR